MVGENSPSVSLFSCDDIIYILCYCTIMCQRTWKAQSHPWPFHEMKKVEIFPHFVLAGYLHTVNCKLNANAAKASNWYKCNLLKGNLKKYQTITICNFQGNSSVCVNILLGSDIKSSDSLKLLGAMIYSKMNFNCVGQSESWSHYETQKFNPQCSQATTIQSCHSPPSYILSPHLAFLQS